MIRDPGHGRDKVEKIGWESEGFASFCINRGRETAWKDMVGISLKNNLHLGEEITTLKSKREHKNQT